MTSGIRPPSASQSSTSGKPPRWACSMSRPCLRMLIGAVVPATAVASIPMTPTRRPSSVPNPVTTASPGTGFSRRISGSASAPISNQVPGSTSAATRSRTGIRPDARCRASACSPPIASAASRRRASSASAAPMPERTASGLVPAGP